ncbi:MAG: DUF502 domain-containing protein [Candidatus Omnitrophica bacterium]|nr:DUF502 domain-containing protein [Candidatus Omnitrophota bacterium]MBU4478229.1 DUF502 domain-containing protein [Candidatus Omnitrophota bacterium]MCG2703296.1 DUF502 domain-containing protein [Candidatus Omnitrophota bacterium]
MLKTKLRRYFITGIVVLLPVFITFYILSISIRFADNLLGRYINPYMKHIFGVSFFGLGLLSIVILIFAVGILATNVFVKRFVPFIERWFLRLPMVYRIYPSVKQLVKFFFSEDKMAFRKVVILEYPKKNVYTLGFLTNEFSTRQPDGTMIETVCVYISSAPNPITGFFVIVPKKDITMLDISIEEAFKIIISGGVLMQNSILMDKLVVKDDCRSG